MDFQYVREAFNVQDSELIDSVFANARMSGSRFAGVNMQRTRFEDVNLAQATWTNVNLSHASIRDADLTGMTIDGVLVSELFDAYRTRGRF